MEPAQQSNQSRQRKKPPPSPARVQGRGGGRGGRGGGNNSRRKDEKKSSPQAKEEKIEPQQQLLENGEDVIRLGTKLENAALDDGEASDEETSQEGGCLVCTDPIKEWAIGQCNHTDVCAICVLRRRELYKEKDCMICKTRLEWVLWTSNRERRFDAAACVAAAVGGQLLADAKLGMYFETDSARQDVHRLLHDCRCPVASCGHDAKTLDRLKRHLAADHGLMYCDVCLSGRKVFIHEQKTYAGKEALEKHCQHGDQGKAGDHIRPHLMCEFCKVYCFGPDELYEHLRQSHETCTLCERAGIRHQYFHNARALQKHYRTAHFLCEDASCLSQGHVVFATALDLKAHQLAEHTDTSGMSKAEARQARQVQLNFSFNNSRGRDERFERTDRTAPHGVIMTGAAGVGVVPATQMRAPSPISSEAPTPAPAPAAPSGPALPSSPAELEQRNRVLIESLRSLLKNPDDFNRFRTISGEFRKGQISAQDYHEQFFGFFGAAQTESLFPELIALLPDADKRAALLLAFETSRRKRAAAAGERPPVPVSLAGAANSAPAAQAHQNNEAMFPSLPGAAPAPPRAALIPNTGSVAGVRRTPNTSGSLSNQDFPSLPASAPKPAGRAAPKASGPPAAADDSAWGAPAPAGGGAGGKKKNKKGTVLMHWG